MIWLFLAALLATHIAWALHKEEDLPILTIVMIILSATTWAKLLHLMLG